MELEKDRRRGPSDAEDDALTEDDGKREHERHRSSDRSKEPPSRGGRDRDRDKKERDRDDDERDRNVERRRESSLDRERYREKDHTRNKDRDRERSSERRDRDRERSTERRDRDRERSTERRDRDRRRDGDKDRARERERDHDRGRGRDNERERVKGVRDMEKEKDVSREKERGRGKEREEQDRDREKEQLYKDKGRDHGRESDRGKVRPRDGDNGKGEGKEEEKEQQDKVSRESSKHETDHLHEGVAADASHIPASSQHSTNEFGERIMKMKEERLKKKNDHSEISSWVNRSRALEDKMKAEKEKALRRMQVLEEQDAVMEESGEDSPVHTGKDLAGLKVLHGLDKVLEGGAVILTLKDQNVLANGDLNEEVDMLENVEIGEQKHRDEAYKAARKKTGIYDDKFGSEEASGRPILPHYDEPTEDEGITLDESGHFTGEAEKKLEELRRRIQNVSSIRSVEDLTFSGKITSDYYTSEEMLQFKKPKKKKFIRKKEKLDLDALEAEAKASGLGVSDLGSRKDGRVQAKREEKEKAEAESRSNAYKLAFSKAEEASRFLAMEQTTNAEEDDSPVFGDDYEDLRKSMEQARKLAFQKQEDATASGPQAVAFQALANKEPAKNLSTDPQENKVVITEMEEFVQSLQFNEDSHKVESKGIFMDEDLATEPMEITTKPGEWDEIGAVDKDDLINENKKEVDTLDETIYEPSVGKGLSGALKLLKDRGALKETVEWGGRNMDKKKSKLVGIHDNDGPKEVHIERTDEYGRILTPKEAFRVLSHKFHGKGPGKMKQEKRMKQFQEELKQKQMKASDTPSLSVERMRETQARFKTPYLVLSGHVKPGQTSDPRSGFGTVEKDLGSLTPMLGDRKVEHFLGIKRKSDGESMGRPPKIPKP